MVIFGAISSVFDYLTFGILLWILNANVDQFRTGWFLESVISAVLIVLIVLIVRTRKPFYKSKPGKYLLLATLAVIIFTLIIPVSPLLNIFDFISLPPIFLFSVATITVLYMLSAEIAKKIFYKYSSN